MPTARLTVCLLGLLAGLCFVGPASADGVLFLRIRPQPDPATLGTAGAGRTAFDEREAVWERSNTRARAIIETICTGCLAPWASPPAKLVAAATLSDVPTPRGVEPDPPLGASEPTSAPSIPERRP